MSAVRRPGVWMLATLLAAWTLGTGAQLAERGGLSGVYSILSADGREAEVTRRIDPRLDFPVPQRLDAAYLFHWDLKRLGFPGEKPPTLIRWRGLLEVPVAGVYGFAVDAQGETVLILDGAPLELRPDAITERRLAVGLHPIAVDYRLTAGEAKLVLSWRPPDRPLAPIPNSSLGADDADFAARRWHQRLGAFLLALGIAVLGTLALLARRSPGGAAGRLLEAAHGERRRLALAAIVLLAAVLRFHDYALVPFHHETADEYQHAWEGWHLLHERVPAAWSTFPDRYPASQTSDFRWFGDRYVMVRPYFDHPPLFSLPVGLLCSLAGAASFIDCTLPVMRLVPIVLSLAGILLLVALARAYGATERAALLAALVYATVPVIILGHRLVKAENLLALLFMGALILAGREGPGATRRALWIGLLCGLALWTKATGIAVIATVLIVLAMRRRWREAGIAAAVTGGFFLLYMAYAWAYDFGIFLKVLQAQSTSKWVTLDSIPDLLGGKAVVKWFGRGSYVWLLLAAGVTAFRKERRLLLPLFVYGVILALTADHRVIYGWYRIPLFPFLCIAGGLYLEGMLEEADLYNAFPFAATAVASGLLYALPAPFVESRQLMYGFAMVAILPFLPRLFSDTGWTKRLARAGAVGLLALFLLTSVMTVGRLLEIYSATRGIQ